MSERQVAISVLTEINQKGAYNNIALRRALDERGDWQSYQRAFVTELVNGTLRNMILIDHIIDSFSRNPSSKMKPFIRELLRTAVYQIQWMDKVPPSAAVNEAVKLAKANGYSALSGFVNGILRNIVRGPVDMPKDMNLRYSYPKWLAEALAGWLGAEAAEIFCAESHIPPPVTICTNTLKTTRDALARNFECTESEIADACLLLKRAGNLTSADAYREGHFFVIDEGAYLAAKATDARPGQKIIDLCAAPGGKSFAMAGMMEDSGEIISCDIHPHKLKLIKNTAARLGIKCIKTVEKDARESKWEKYADAVLLDAPCSGLGVIRRRPDIKYTKTMADVRAMAAFQRELLTAAARCVRPGGILVYSTCTVAREENEDNIQWFLDNFPYSLDGQYIKYGGFFIARMVREPAR